MRQNKGGFYLYIFCIYLSCVIFLGTIIIPFSFYAFQKILFLIKRNSDLQNIILLFAVLKKDLQKTPKKVVNLKLLTENQIIWKEKDFDIGFFYSKETESFFRISGLYDQEKRTWKQSKKCLLMKNIFVSFFPTDGENTNIKCIVVDKNNHRFSCVMMSQSCIYKKNIKN